MGDELLLTSKERAAVNAGRWFSGLPAEARHDLLRHARARRYRDGEQICAQGQQACWVACARGAVRLCSGSGELIFFSYVAPGEWFGDVEVFGGIGALYNAYAHGNCTVLCVEPEDAWQILRTHPSLYGALAWLQARRTRKLFGVIDDLKTLSLRARLAKQLVELVKRHGEPAQTPIRIGLRISQTELAGLIGVSRQRINLELRALKDQGIVQLGLRLVVLDFPALLRVAASDGRKWTGDASACREPALLAG